MGRWVLLFITAVAVSVASTGARGPNQPAGQAPQKPTLYIVSNSHLDTQWNWTVQDTIRDLVPATFRDNFALFERFPGYVFNFESAVHYMWFKEYHPDEWPTVKKYVDSNRWRLSGGWIVAADTHIPSPEALMRQALYGKRFFRQEFSKIPIDVYLPDCFGFSYALPAVANHSGLRAFSTQKLSWGAPAPPPFAVGRWKGVDGSTVVAALRAGDYTARLRSDVSTDPKWNADLADLGDGKKVGFRYFGVGDQGGAPDAESVEWLEKAMANSAAPVTVRNTSADQLARDLSEAQRAALPEYDGELLLKTHGVGCFTSQAALKRWNRRNELLADAAERASVVAEWLGGPAYPRERLRAAWTRVLWHQFHDDLTGTSIPQAYQFSWNDELLSMNEFASMTAGALGTVASALDTTGKGIPLVVFNPLAMRRHDLVEADVRFGTTAPARVSVVDTVSGDEVPAQVVRRDDRVARVLWMADMPPVGFRVYTVAPRLAAATTSAVRATPSSLENERYSVHLDANGDIASVVDHVTGGELLSAPVRLEMLDNASPAWPAWEVLWSEVTRKPRAYPTSPTIRVVERGPVRATLEITRTAGGSAFRQRVSLWLGGDRVSVENDVDWRTPGTLLKAAFPFSSSNQKATFDLSLGAIQRSNATEKAYEVPGQQWADLTDEGGKFGVAVLNDGKYGWDKPGDHTLRLTLIHTPRPDKEFVYQSSNDIGRHHFTYEIAGHRGDWRAGRVPALASRLNQPLLVFQTAGHGGPLGRAFSMIGIDPDGSQVAVRALKKAEDSDEIVIRVQELHGQALPRVELTLPVAIAAAREVNAAEEPLGPAPLVGGKLVFDLRRYQARTFSLRPGSSTPKVATFQAAPIALPFNVDAVSADTDRGDGDLDGRGRSLPAELFPASLTLDGVPFTLGPTRAGAANVVLPRSQRVALPEGVYRQVHVLATAVGGDGSGTFRFERAGTPLATAMLRAQEWEGAIGQWDSRLADDRLLREPFVAAARDQSWTLEAIEAQMVVKRAPDGTPVGLDRLVPGFVRRDEIAMVFGHRHSPQGNEIYIPAYVFRYVLDVPPEATDIVLPAYSRMRILAMTAASTPIGVTTAAQVLVAPELPGVKRGAVLGPQ